MRESNNRTIEIVCDYIYALYKLGLVTEREFLNQDAFNELYDALRGVSDECESQYS